MAGKSAWKICGTDGKTRAQAHNLRDALAICGMFGSGCTVRYNHMKLTTIWTEGAEDVSAAERVAAAYNIAKARVPGMYERLMQHNERRIAAKNLRE